MTTTIRKAWTAFVRPLTGGTARVVVRKVGGPAPIGGVPPVPDRDFRLVAGSRPSGEAFDRDVAEGYVRRFNEEGLINAFVRMSKDRYVSRNGDMTLERIREDRDGLDLSDGLNNRIAASMSALREERDDVPGPRRDGKPVTETDDEAYWKGVDERLAVHIPTAEEVAEEAARYEADKG